MKLQLTRPLVFFDLETTGIDPYNDRIIEISVLKVTPDGKEDLYSRRINPGRPIPAEATAIHHITDEMVANEPKFEEVAPKLRAYLQNCDLAGFNSARFDVPMLVQEFQRANCPLNMDGVKHIDVQTIFHKKEPRTLVAAYRFYCNKELEGAHSARADISATYEVLKAQLEKYGDIPTDVNGLDEYTKYKPGKAADDKLVKNQAGEYCFNFSKFKGKTVREVFTNNPGMIAWCLDPSRGFSPQVVKIFEEVKNSISPQK